MIFAALALCSYNTWPSHLVSWLSALTVSGQCGWLFDQATVCNGYSQWEHQGIVQASFRDGRRRELQPRGEAQKVSSASCRCVDCFVSNGLVTSFVKRWGGVAGLIYFFVPFVAVHFVLRIVNILIFMAWSWYICVRTLCWFNCLLYKLWYRTGI